MNYWIIRWTSSVMRLSQSYRPPREAGRRKIPQKSSSVWGYCQWCVFILVIIRVGLRPCLVSTVLFPAGHWRWKVKYCMEICGGQLWPKHQPNNWVSSCCCPPKKSYLFSCSQLITVYHFRTWYIMLDMRNYDGCFFFYYILTLQRKRKEENNWQIIQNENSCSRFINLSIKIHSIDCSNAKNHLLLHFMTL